MTCLLCLDAGRASDDWKSLVSVQEHAASVHGYPTTLQRAVKSREVEPGHYIYTMPDGKDWLDAVREGGNYVGGI